MKLLNPFYEAVAWLIVHIHAVLSPVLGKNNGWSWALSIVLLTVAMRLLLFPLFVKQTRNMRAMQVLQPKMKELQAKYKNDKERLNQEMMALWKEHGTNPFAGCLPTCPADPGLPRSVPRAELAQAQPRLRRCQRAELLQQPLRHFYRSGAFRCGVEDLRRADLARRSTRVRTSLHLVGGSATSTKILTVVLIVLMGASTFWTQRQLMARNKAAGTGTDQMPQQQKVMLYILPLTFAIFGYRFPLGVLLYWLTTNLWSMGQQHFVIARMDANDAAGHGQQSRKARVARRPARSPRGPARRCRPPPNGAGGGAGRPAPATVAGHPAGEPQQEPQQRRPALTRAGLLEDPVTDETDVTPAPLGGRGARRLLAGARGRHRRRLSRGAARHRRPRR